MSELSFDNTKNLIHLVLSHQIKDARKELHQTLVDLGSNEGQFYAGIKKHAPRLQLTTDQWFELLCRLPNRILRSDLHLPGLLSEEQIRRLPPVTG